MTCTATRHIVPFWMHMRWRLGLVQARDGHRSRDNSNSTRGGRRDQPEGGEAHTCPWCGSADTFHVQRGFVGATDDRNQFLTCNACDRVTFEIISKTIRDMRVGQFRAGGVYRDVARQTRYRITRVLKVGLNECLLYVKPVIRPEPDTAPSAERD
ncbi:hypothetical protein BH20CHL3_BH20CHL3_06380 [soil metagenome]